MRERPSAMVVDLFTTEAIKVAEDLGMIKYVFAAQSAWSFAQTAYYPYIEKISLQERVEIPGCVTVPAHSLVECLFVRRNPEFVRVGLEIATADGVLVNTWEDLDRRNLESFRSEEYMGGIIKAPVLAVGPLVSGPGRSDSRSEVMEWLDKQPAESVLFISFGTGGTLTTRQTIEMAWGLEMSQQRFAWVFRQPLDYDASASQYFESKAGDEHLVARYLPEGFLDRTKEKGKVVPLWGPQAEILAHGSIGGFLSHCGWNSTLESLVNGVPMIGWPLYAEQDMNATMLAHEIGVAVRPEARPSWEVIGRVEIETMIREVMVGEDRVRMRSRAEELKNSMEKAIGKGGTSSEALAMFVKECEVKAGFMAKNESDAYDRVNDAIQ
ncbi:Anthocyanidin 3-O-glucosyltransferase 5-like protein [Drosera capensis]